MAAGGAERPMKQMSLTRHTNISVQKNCATILSTRRRHQECYLWKKNNEGDKNDKSYTVVSSSLVGLIFFFDLLPFPTSSPNILVDWSSGLRQGKAVVSGNNDYERTASIFRVKRHIFLYSISCIPSWRILRVSTGRNSNGHKLRWPRRDENPEVQWATPQGFGVWERMSRATLIYRNYTSRRELLWTRDRLVERPPPGHGNEENI